MFLPITDVSFLKKYLSFDLVHRLIFQKKSLNILGSGSYSTLAGTNTTIADTKSTSADANGTSADANSTSADAKNSSAGTKANIADGIEPMDDLFERNSTAGDYSDGGEIKVAF